MLMDLVLIIIGFLVLVWGGDRFVTGASATARNLGVSPLLVGMVIVGFGTSAPEIVVSIVAAINDNPGIAIGNAIGSNITNIGLVLGITALITPLTVHSTTLKREFPLLFICMLLVSVLFIGGDLTRMDGVILLASMVVLITVMVRIGMGQRSAGDIMSIEYSEEIPAHMAPWKATAWVIVGIILLPLGSEFVVIGASGISRALGVSDLVIGLTVVALGTSLPELMASLIGALKNEHEIAIGNILGSNMFNLLAVIGFPAIIHPANFGTEIITRDFPFMLVLTALLFVMSIGRTGHGRVGRVGGAVLLAIYIIYIGVMFQVATN